MTRYEATWSVSLDIDETSSQDDAEALMIAMHVFVEERQLHSQLRNDLNRGRRDEWATHVVIAPLAAKKAL